MLLRRFFVVLKSDDTAYSATGEKPDGFFKFERFGNKCRITINVTGLRQPEDFSYKGVLVAFKDNKPEIIDMGILKLDDMGRCISQWLCDPEDVGGKGVALEDIKVCAVVVDNLQRQLITPLVGFIDDGYMDWKKSIEKVKDVDDVEPALKLSEEPPGKDEMEDTGSEIEFNVTGEDEVEDEVSENNIEVIPESDALGKVEETEEAEEQPQSKKIKEPMELKYVEVSGESQYIQNLKKYIEDVINHLQEVQPFEEIMEGYKWWRIENNYALNKDHYLMGLFFEQDKVKYIVYAMPGKFNVFDQPYGGLTGFVCWRPSKGQRFEYDADGYWIMHIDALTGQIVVPLKPTPPPLFKAYD